MQGSKIQTQVTKTFKKYLKKQGRVGFELKQLNELFLLGAQLSHITTIINTNHTLLSTFKILLLIHRLTLEPNTSKQQITSLLCSLTYSTKDKIQKHLSQKLIQPYRLYLQRRLTISTGEWSQLGEMRAYQLINLINLGTSFSDMIYILGRYYLNKFGCAVDFNILLGVDIQGLYAEMVQSIRRPAKKRILQQIETVHEKMYVVYYNCYFHKYLKSYIPRWVMTDVVRIGRMSTPQKSSKSTFSGTNKSRACSSVKSKNSIKLNQNLADSCLFLNEKVQEEIQHESIQQPNIQNIQYCNIQNTKQNRFRQMNRQQQLKMEQGFKLLLSMQRVIKISQP